MVKKWMNPELLALKRNIDERLNIAEVSGNHEGSNLRTLHPRENSIKARRERRKQDRAMRKTRRLAFSRHTPVDTLIKHTTKMDKVEKKKKLKADRAAKKASEPATKKTSAVVEETASQQLIKFKKEAAKEARKQQRRMVREEDKEVRKYAKKLGFQKRKSKTLPKSFEADGLSYLLDVCDFKSNREEEIVPSGSRSKKVSADDDDDRFSESDLENDNLDESMEVSDGEADSEIDDPDKPRSSKKVTFADSSTAGPTVKEDIYGRTLDDDGNVVSRPKLNILPRSDGETGTGGTESKKLVQLRKIVNGIVNRLSEANIASACNQVSGLLNNYSRHDVKDQLRQIVFKACLQPQRLPFRLMLEHALFIAVLYSTVSSDFGAEIIEGLVVKLDELRKETRIKGAGGEDKKMENCTVLLCHLVDFKVVNAVLLTEILKEFIGDFGEREVDLITVTLQMGGFTMRKEDPVGLRDVISLIQTKARSSDDHKVDDQTRLSFMLETLAAVKNNNDLSKVMQYDPSLLQHLRKVQQGLVKDKGESPLRVTLTDIRNVSTSGRWWVVGSAWDPSASSVGAKVSMSNQEGPDDNSGSRQKFSADLLELARKHRMNTDVRRTIFCVMLSAEDYLDAFEKLLKLNYKGSLEREIIHIAVNCCIREKQFNPYYAHLINKFCSYHKRFQLTTQFALWDKIKQMNNLKLGERKRLGTLTADVIRLKALGLNVLKVVDFGSCDAAVDKFVENVLRSLCSKCELEPLQDIVTSVAMQPKLKEFCEALRFFITKMFLSTTQDGEVDDRSDSQQQEKTERQRFVFVRNLLHMSSTSF